MWKSPREFLTLNTVHLIYHLMIHLSTAQEEKQNRERWKDGNLQDEMEKERMLVRVKKGGVER